MLLFNGIINITTAGSTGSANTIPLRGLCRNIIVKPATETTEYDIKIVNPSGATVYERLDEVGTLSEVTALPLFGIYTITLSNATANELFIIQTLCEE